MQSHCEGSLRVYYRFVKAWRSSEFNGEVGMISFMFMFLLLTRGTACNFAVFG